MTETPFHDLRDAFRDYVQTWAPDILSFCDSALFVDHKFVEPVPAVLPCVNQLSELSDKACGATQPLTDAIISLSKHFPWQQSYSIDDPGFDENYLNNYGWFNLIAPSGPFISNDLRLSIGYWGRGLHYPKHWHEPEEIYLTLAGSATFCSEDKSPVVGRPGTTVCNASNQPHSATFDEDPLLAAAFWRGGRLEAKSGLEAV